MVTVFNKSEILEADKTEILFREIFDLLFSQFNGTIQIGKQVLINLNTLGATS